MAADHPRRGTHQTEHPSQHNGTGSDHGIVAPEERSQAAEPAAARRVGLDRNEGAGKGPHAPLRNRERLRGRRATVLARSTGSGLPALDPLSVRQVRTATQGGAGDGSGGDPSVTIGGQCLRLVAVGPVATSGRGVAAHDGDGTDGKRGVGQDGAAARPGSPDAQNDDGGCGSDAAGVAASGSDAGCGGGGLEHRNRRRASASARAGRTPADRPRPQASSTPGKTAARHR